MGDKLHIGDVFRDADGESLVVFGKVMSRNGLLYSLAVLGRIDCRFCYSARGGLERQKADTRMDLAAEVWARKALESHRDAGRAKLARTRALHLKRAAKFHRRAATVRRVAERLAEVARG